MGRSRVMKRVKSLIFISLVITGVFITSCNKKIPAFPKELTSYLPYTEGQELVFKDGENNEIKFTISKIDISKEGSYRKCTKCAWSPYMKFETVSGVADYMYGELFANVNNLQIGISVRNRYYYDSINCDPFATNAVAVIGDTIKILNKNGEEVVIVKGKGIIKFTEETVVWSLAE